MSRPLRGLGLAVTLALGVSVAAAGPPVPRDRLTQVPVRLAVLLDDGRALALEALVVKPNVSGRLPLAVITHGTPRESEARRQMSAGHMSFQAEELARRGYLAVVVLRRGYGASEGVWAESSGQCDAADQRAVQRGQPVAFAQDGGDGPDARAAGQGAELVSVEHEPGSPRCRRCQGGSLEQVRARLNPQRR